MLVTTREEFNDFLNLARNEQTIVFDTETTGVDLYGGDAMIGVAFYLPNAERSYYIPFRHDEPPNMQGVFIADLSPLFQKAKMIGFNIKFDLHVIRNEGLPLPSFVEDVRVLAHLLNENEFLSNNMQNSGAYALKRLARKYLGPDATPGEQQLFTALEGLGYRGKAAKGEMWRLSAEVVGPYAEDDVILTWRLRDMYLPHLARWGMENLYHELNTFLLNVLFRMEQNGMYVDSYINSELEQEAEKQAGELRAAIQAYVGDDDFNPSSPAQLRRAFQKLGYDVPSTDHYELTPLADREPLADMVLRYRHATTAYTRYYAQFDKVGRDGKVHPTIDPAGTKTGRVSAHSPNMLNIPRSAGSGYEVKRIFTVPKGWRLVQIDYARQELILATHYAKEQNMRGMIMYGVDMHQYTADKLRVRELLYGNKTDREILRQKGVPDARLAAMSDEEAANEVRKIVRFMGKTLNFSLLYGMGPKTAARRWFLSQAQAKELIEGWHRLFPNFQQAYYTMAHIAEHRRDAAGNPGGKFQYVRLEDGRCRRFHEYAAPYSAWRPPYKDAWNFLIQGTGSWIMRRALLKHLERYGWDTQNWFLPCLTVYDSFIFYIREDRVHTIADIADLMLDFPQFDPSLEVEVSWSDTSWHDLQDVPRETLDEWRKQLSAA